MRLTSMNLAVLGDDQTLAVPRWVTADSALMDRLLRGARWLDGAWIELNGARSLIRCVDANGVERAIDAIVLDNSGRSIDLSSPARRAGVVFGWIASPSPETTLDIASQLATSVPTWHSVNTEDIQAACRSIASMMKP